MALACRMCLREACAGRVGSSSGYGAVARVVVARARRVAAASRHCVRRRVINGGALSLGNGWRRG